MTYEEADLINLPNDNIYLKLMIDGVTSRAFSAVTLLPFIADKSEKPNVVKASIEKYAI